MSPQNPNWSYHEFLAYLLLYAANADLKVSKDEKKMLFTKVSPEEYERIRKEFKNANDYERLQTITSYKGKFYKDEESRVKLFKDLKDMFLADEQYNSIENAIFMGLKKVLN